MVLKVRQTSATTKLLRDARNDAKLDEVSACSHHVEDGQTAVKHSALRHLENLQHSFTQDLRQKAAQWAAENEVPYTVVERICASIR